MIREKGSKIELKTIKKKYEKNVILLLVEKIRKGHF